MDRWYDYIPSGYRLPMLLVLQELSRLRTIQDSFILVGGLSLLMQERLHHQVMWDVDLLFRDKFSILKFLALPKDPSFDIVSIDGGFADSATIVSYHTSWGFGARWINVDYFTRSKWYYFHKVTIDKRGDFEERIELEGKGINIKLPVAYPWDMFIEKALSPRLENDLAVSNDLSYDLRHVFILLEQEKENREFWDYVQKKARRFGQIRELRDRLLMILDRRQQVGYGHIRVPDSLPKTIEGWKETRELEGEG